MSAKFQCLQLETFQRISINSAKEDKKTWPTLLTFPTTEGSFANAARNTRVRQAFRPHTRNEIFSVLSQPDHKTATTILSGHELTRDSSRNTRSQSSQLAEPLWTDPCLKSGISECANFPFILFFNFLMIIIKAQDGNELSNILPKSSHARKSHHYHHGSQTNADTSCFHWCTLRGAENIGP